MKYKFIYLLTISLVIISSCRSKNPVNYEGGGMAREVASTSMEAPPPPPPEALKSADAGQPVTPAPEQVITVERKVIRNGNVEVRVNDITTGKQQVDSLVKKYRAYYAGEVYNNQDFSHSYSLTIRIPAASFDGFILALETGVGEIAFKNINAQDVTEQFIDLETRLKNKRNYMERYRTLLNKAQSVKDILDIEEKIRVIEEEIESTEGRLKYLNNQVDFSTLELQITRKNDYNQYSRTPGTFWERLKLSVVKGWFGLVSFSLFVVRLWGFWIIGAILFWFIRKRIRERKK
jgi:hypothetical protein